MSRSEGWSLFGQGVNKAQALDVSGLSWY
jgi:hypothetical protein